MLWPQSDKEGWPAARFLAIIAEHEIAERGHRRIERDFAEARLPAGKTFDSFDFEAVREVGNNKYASEREVGNKYASFQTIAVEDVEQE